MFIDCHAHLTDIAFDEDRDDLINKCFDMGLDAIITSGFNLSSSHEALTLAENYKNIYASVGVYPENIEELGKNALEELYNLGKNSKTVAIGEIGLQYTDNMPSKERQIEGFLKQIQVAYELEKPIVIHCREAIGDMIEILEKNKELLKFGGTMHCFSGSYEIAKRLLKLGLYISVGGVSTFKNANNLREVLKTIPLERILLETDCPYLTPHPYRGKRNSPCFIPTIAENLALLKEMEIERVAEITTLNAKELFHL